MVYVNQIFLSCVWGSLCDIRSYSLKLFCSNNLDQQIYARFTYAISSVEQRSKLDDKYRCSHQRLELNIQSLHIIDRHTPHAGRSEHAEPTHVTDPYITACRSACLAFSLDRSDSSLADQEDLARTASRESGRSNSRLTDAMHALLQRVTLFPTRGQRIQI